MVPRTARGKALMVLMATSGMQWTPLAWAQGAAHAYATERSIDDYLMTDRTAEIALARSAAPAAISMHATVLVLGRHGYETAVVGDNGFVCVVERAWMSPLKAPDFWNPKLRGPVCFNPPAAHSILPITLKRTEMALARKSKSEFISELKAAVESRSLPALEPGAMSYMMSRNQYLGDSAQHWHPHLMFYVAKTIAPVWGAEFPGSPVLLNPQFQDSPEPITVFIVPVSKWSDGAPEAIQSHD